MPIPGFHWPFLVALSLSREGCPEASIIDKKGVKGKIINQFLHFAISGEEAPL
jgi:hypothetical protein